MTAAFVGERDNHQRLIEVSLGSGVPERSLCSDEIFPWLPPPEN